MIMKSFAKKYFDFLTTDLSGLNLTAIKEFDDFYLRQIKDSTLPATLCPVFSEELSNSNYILDIGFGGGFPLLPLANIFPQKKFIGIDARKKKVDAVTKIAEHLQLKNTTVLHGRIEDFVIDKKCVVTVKAVGKIEDLLSKLNFTEDVKVFFYKGPNLIEKENLSSNKIVKQWEIIENKAIEFDGLKRLIVGFQPKSVPRGTIKNKVVLSSKIK